MNRVDLNADVGEGAGYDADLIPLVTSVNVACGGHAGDENVIAATVRLAAAHGVTVGAHPSFPDREGFGRREISLEPDELRETLRNQVELLTAIAAGEDIRVRHVKPHGALYNMAARDITLASTVARLVSEIDPSLVLVGLAGSALIEAGRQVGLRTASEVFADRGYRGDGSLVPRGQVDAILYDADAVAARALDMARDGIVCAATGERVVIQADTICVHGDTPGAVAMARRVRDVLTAAGVQLRSFVDR
jgi:UPF0271 protein